MKASDLKPGMAINLEGRILVLTKVEHVKPGKGGAFAQCKFKSIPDGATTEKRFRSEDDVDRITLDRREMEYLYSDQSGHIFMDSDTFDQSTVPAELINDLMVFVKPNTTITTLHHDGKIISVELPATVELEVTETPPVVKGATATNQLKEATLETGLKTRVPPFIETGEVVRISTDDGSYQARVN